MPELKQTQEELSWGRKHGALAVLFLVYVLNFLDRQILAILIDPIQRELKVGDTAMGLLTGTTFALFYALAGVPIARLADRWSRRNVILIGLSTWSLLTALSGLVSRYWQLALLRVGVGVGEASSNPASHALIAEMYPPQWRATALAVFSMGAHAGIMLGLLFGGYIAQSSDWRTALIVAGLIGLPVALLVRLVVPDLRSEVPADKADSGFGLALLGNPRYRWVAIGAALSSLPGYALVIWGATHLIRVHELDLAQAGKWFGLAAGIGGALGALVGGLLADRLGQGRRLIVPMVASVLVVPAAAVFLLSEQVELAIAGAGLALALGPMWMGPVFSAVQENVSASDRARAAALLILVVNLVGLGLGPTLVGVLSDLLAQQAQEKSLGYSLLAVSFFYLAAAACYQRARGASPLPPAHSEKGQLD